jgi:predicted nucleic acid-binding protein
MNLYIDSSVLLRRVLSQPEALPDLPEAELAIASKLIVVECWRSLDRLRLQEIVPDEVAAARVSAVRKSLRHLELLGVSEAVLERAAQPQPVTLGTLDAIHLASALLWREKTGREIVLATHDRQLALAARASGLAVIG